MSTSDIGAARISYALLALVLLLTFCGPSHAARFDWRRELSTIERQLSGPGAFNQHDCAAVIGAWTDRLAALPSSDFTPRDRREAESILEQGDEWLTRFFHVRMLLKRRWNGFSSPSFACLTAMRRAFRYARFAEDYLAEWLAAHGGLQSAPLAVFDGKVPHVLTNPAGTGLEFEAGDILIMRGPNFFSSMIARSGDEEGDFSHLAIVARDEGGEKFIVEALVESGTGLTPLAEYLRNSDESRVVLVRYRDPKIADRAGLEIYRKVRAAIDAGRPIPYNFNLDMADDSRFFCAQIARYAFLAASSREVVLPEFKTSLRRFLHTTLAKSLKISVGETFAPSDIQFDRRFEIVAEFRNPALLTSTRRANVAVSRLLAWLRNGYGLQEDIATEIVAPVVTSVMFQQGDAQAIDSHSVAILMKFSNAFDILTARAASIDGQATRELGHPLTFRELETELERYRLNDCSRAREPFDGAELHKVMKPANPDCRLVVR